MKLAENQIRQLVKNPNNSNQIEEGRKYESRLRLFTESKDKDEIKVESSWNEFKYFMKRAISTEKEIRISDFILYPLSTVSITESLLNDLYKVFSAGNSYFNIETIKQKGGEKMQKLLEKSNVKNWIEEVVKDSLKNKPNTVAVVDRNEEGEPYLVMVDNERIVDFELSKDLINLEYIVFKHSEDKETKTKRFSVYDEESYNVVAVIDGGEPIIEKTTKHQNGKCPARMVINKPLNQKNTFSRKIPISSSIGKLQEWQYFDIYKFYTDHYGPFPVVEMMRSTCGNMNCDGGYVTDVVEFADGLGTGSYEKRTKCETCASINTIGVGTKILLDPEEEGDPKGAGKFRMISSPVENLKYLDEKLISIEERIKLKVVGIDNVSSKEAINEKQMQGSFESRTNVLLGIKTNLDDLYKWVIKTFGRIYIPGSPLTISVNWGTEWYLISEDELQERYKKGKDMNLPKAELDMIYHQILETKYKGNPEKIERLKIINELDPCPHSSLDDKIKKSEKGIISPKELILSERIITFVNRFEQNNGSIIDFGKDIEKGKKQETILKQLKIYADEQARTIETE